MAIRAACRKPWSRRTCQAVAAAHAAQTGQLLLTLLVMASATISTYTLISINLFATHTLGLSTAVGFGAVVVGGATGMLQSHRLAGSATGWDASP